MAWLLVLLLLAAPVVITANVALRTSDNKEYIPPVLATIVTVVSAFVLSGQSFINIDLRWAVLAGIFGATALGFGFWFAIDFEEEATAVSWCVLPFIVVFFFGGSMAWLLVLFLLAAPAVITANVALRTSDNKEYIHPVLATIVTVVSVVCLWGQSFTNVNPGWAAIAGILGATALGLGFWFANDLEEEAAAVSWCALPFIVVFFFGGALVWWGNLLILGISIVIAGAILSSL